MTGEHELPGGGGEREPASVLLPAPARPKERRVDELEVPGFGKALGFGAAICGERYGLAVVLHNKTNFAIE